MVCGLLVLRTYLWRRSLLSYRPFLIFVACTYMQRIFARYNYGFGKKENYSTLYICFKDARSSTCRPIRHIRARKMY